MKIEDRWKALEAWGFLYANNLLSITEYNKVAERIDEKFPDDEPKAPTHEEIMSKWFLYESSWYRVSMYQPKSTLYPYFFHGIKRAKSFFIGLESADTPMEVLP